MTQIGNKNSPVPITGNQLQDGLITTSKIAIGAVTEDKFSESAKQASNFIYDDSVTDFGLGPADLNVQKAIEATVAGQAFPRIHVRDERAPGTSGGQYDPGDWRVRVLNSVLTNTISGASLSSNRITLPSGLYYVTGSAPSFRSQTSIARIYVVGVGTAIVGTSSFSRDQSGGAAISHSFLNGMLTLSETRDIELQQRFENTDSTNGGVSSDFGEPSVYSDVMIWRISNA